MHTEQAPQVKYLKNYMPPSHEVVSLSLCFDLREGMARVTAETRYRCVDVAGADLVLNGEQLKLISVEVDGSDFSRDSYVVDDEALTLLGLPVEFTLKIVTEICPENNTSLEGLYQSSGTYCTQCEAEGFRRITYFQDRPDVMSVFDVRIEADKEKYPVLLSNGNLKDSGDLDDGRHFTMWNDPHMKPCYLFALVAGDLVQKEDCYRTTSGRDVVLRIYVRESDIGQVDHAMESLKASMKWDEDVYGLEYDLDLFNIVAVSDFNMGAMENKSLNIFNTALVLAHPDTATDMDFGRVESVIGHEYFHNWSGNRVTCRDWFQLSLKEGLTVFRDQEFSADMNSRGVQRIDDVQMLRRMQFPEDAGPMSHPIRPESYIEMNNFYTMTVYEKGAEVIRMTHTLLGAENYRKATDLYFSRHDGQAVTCDDWVQCMEDASSMDLSQFRLWYSQAGTPRVRVSGEYDENLKIYTMHLSQETPPTPGQDEKDALLMPIKVGLVAPSGEDLDLGDGKTSRIVLFSQKEQSIVFENIGVKPVPSVLRNFSAPVRLDSDLSDADLRFLMVHDSDGFNRWEAGQKLSMRVLSSMLEGASDAPDDAYLLSFRQLLEKCLDGKSDRALMARSIMLPDVSSVFQECNEVDPQHIHYVRKRLLKMICEKNLDLLNRIYDENLLEGDFRKDGEAIGMRALKNIVLSYLVQGEDAEAVNVAYLQYTHANNMTDREGAIMAINHTDDPLRQACYEDMYERYKAYPLVMDKWFKLQASACRDGIFADLKMLRGHDDFVMTNPNRVRSVYSAFAMLNPVKFHDASGVGYDFLTDAIIELNTINPQIASRMVGPMREWRRFTKIRRDKMRECLERIMKIDDLSKDVYEVVSKTLA